MEAGRQEDKRAHQRDKSMKFLCADQADHSIFLVEGEFVLRMNAQTCALPDDLFSGLALDDTGRDPDRQAEEGMDNKGNARPTGELAAFEERAIHADAVP